MPKKPTLRAAAMDVLVASDALFVVMTGHGKAGKSYGLMQDEKQHEEWVIRLRALQAALRITDEEWETMSAALSGQTH